MLAREVRAGHPTCEQGWGWNDDFARGTAQLFIPLVGTIRILVLSRRLVSAVLYFLSAYSLSIQTGVVRDCGSSFPVDARCVSARACIRVSVDQCTCTRTSYRPRAGRSGRRARTRQLNPFNSRVQL